MDDKAPVSLVERVSGKTGAQLAAEGIERAVTHANRVEPSWADRACIMLARFMAGRSEFKIEQARSWAYANGLPVPPAPGAWGSVTRRAVKAGRIEFARFETSDNPSQHSKPVKVWRVK